MLNLLTRSVKSKEDEEASLFSSAHVAEKRRAEAWLEDRLMKSKRLHANELLEETVMVTPVMAEVMLTKNVGNRKLSRTHVDWFIQIINAGEWQFSAKGVSFSRDGQLNDGQHRLTAIAQSGRPVPLKVSFGEARAVFAILDTGKARTAGDVLGIAGHKNFNVLAAAARLHQIVTSNNPTGRHRFTNADIADYARQHPGLEDATTPALRVRSVNCSASAAATAFYLIASNTRRPARYPGFVDLMATGDGLRAKDPIKVLREGLMKREFEAAARDGGTKNIYVSASIILAWNKWVSGKTVSLDALKWDGVAFPQPE